VDKVKREFVQRKYENISLVIKGEKDFKRWPVIKGAFKYLFKSTFGCSDSVNFVGCIFSAGLAYTAEKHHEIRKEQQNEKAGTAKV
jgi:hypothetical protein